MNQISEIVVQKSISKFGYWTHSGLPYIASKEPTLNIHAPVTS